MAEQGYTDTDQLSDVIDVIQLGRKTGTLMVARGEGMGLESGVIIFANGQPTQAQLGQRNSAEALRMLNLWKACRFVFVPGASSHISPVSSTPIPPISLSPSPTRDRDSGGLPRLSNLGSSTGSIAARSQPERAFSPLLIIPQRLWMADDALNALERRGFTRNHRRLFLLLDGYRTIKDLSALTGRSADEVYVMLDQLEKAGFIQL